MKREYVNTTQKSIQYHIDDTTNIHLDRGPITTMAHKVGRNPKIGS
jgi:hypothetical protein